MSESKPNVLLLVVDCLRSDRAYGLAGGARVPTLLDVKARGTAFTTAVSSAANTSPAFASLMTSMFGFRHGVRSIRGYKLKEGIRTLPELLQAGGYRTCAEVSGPLVPDIALNRGFDEYRYRERWHTVFSSYLPRLKRRFSEMGEPWFLLLHLWALHRPRKIRLGWNRPAYGETIYDRSLSSIDREIGDFLGAVPQERTLLVLTGDHGERMNDGDEHVDNHRPAFPIRALEPLMDLWHHKRKRKRQRRAKRRGEWHGAIGGLCHGFHVYDDVTRVPLVFAGPGAPEGMTVPDLVRHVDVAPTILDLVGVEAAEGFGGDGRSLVPFMRGETLPPEPAYLEATGHNLRSPTRWIASIRNEKMKYTKGLLDPDMPEELYDLEADPMEKTNLAPDDPRLPEMQKLLEDLAGDLAKDDIVVNLSEKEMADLDQTLKALGYLD
ncbi:MAG: sulfatase [Planctomycetota bacterium]|jgi:arylsulfatase A-like enzyme